MLAQEVWRGWPRRLGAGVVVTHPDMTWNISRHRCPFTAPADYLDILQPANILTVASDYCLGTCVMFAEGAWRAWPRRLGAIGVVAHPVPDLKYFLVQGAPSTPLDIFCGLHIF